MPWAVTDMARRNRIRNRLPRPLNDFEYNLLQVGILAVGVAFFGMGFFIALPLALVGNLIVKLI